MLAENTDFVIWASNEQLKFWTHFSIFFQMNYASLIGRTAPHPATQPQTPANDEDTRSRQAFHV